MNYAIQHSYNFHALFLFVIYFIVALFLIRLSEISRSGIDVDCAAALQILRSG
jgi:hypothetical protein